MIIGIIREDKEPRDNRTPLVPLQCREIMEKGTEVLVQSSPHRCYSDEEYRIQGVKVADEIRQADILMGVKEVPVEMLIPGKIYFIFSHTIKMQVYNRELLKAILKNNITLIDYEVLRKEGHRLIAFGEFAGMVGAHNAIWTWLKRKGRRDFPRMHTFFEYAEAKDFYKKENFSPVKIVLTGTGRVGSGAAKVLDDMGFSSVSPDKFLYKEYNAPVYTQLEVEHYVERKDRKPFAREDYFGNPEDFRSTFGPYTAAADILINGIYWDNRSPAFFTLEDIRKREWRIKVIADITCDIAPDSSIPVTLRPTTIGDPVMGIDRQSGLETNPYGDNTIDVMAIDNLPNELPRNASRKFGRRFLTHILPELLKDKSEILEQATLAKGGELGRDFQYLREYVDEE